MRKLTPKQERFVDEYLIDLNASAACLRAGYKSKNPDVDGYKLLVNPSISARIEERRQTIHKKVNLTQEWVLEKLIECVGKSMQEVEVEKWDYEEKTMVGTGEYIYDSRGATKALELLGKHLKMFTDKVEHSGEVGVKIEDDIK